MINIRLLVMLIACLSAAAIAAVVLAYGLGRHQGSVSERKACEAEIHAAELTAERQVADYKRTIDSYIDADRLSDTSTCKDLPRASGTQPRAVCYTRADIQRDSYIRAG